MLSNMEQRIRECYDAFLESVTEDWGLWEIALLEYYRWPLEHWREAPEEDWDQPIPACFQDLAPELPRLVECKAEVHPNDDCASVQLNLERRYGWDDFGPRNHKERRLSPQAVGSLLEYYFLVEAQGDDCGGRSCRILFEEESDTTVLERIVRHGVRTPEEQMTLALRLKEFCEGWQLEDESEEERDWLLDLMEELLEDELEKERNWLLDLTEELLEDAFRRGCGEAGWHLYAFLSEKEQFGDPWVPLDLLREAAEAGSVDAQCEIARLFYLNAMGQLDTYTAQYYGDGFSAKEAVRWLEQALPHKIEAAILLARLFLEGKGVPADEARAVRYLTAAVGGQYEGDGAFVERCTCFWMLAKCYAEGRGATKDRRKAAELYRQAQDSDYYLFDYYKDGVDVPRNPRAAVRYWMRDTCFHHGLLLWVDILVRVSAPEGCIRLRPEALRSVWRLQIGKNAFYDLMGTDLLGASGRTDDPYAQLCGLLDWEKARLLYDGARGGDSRCGDILKELLTSGAATEEMLEQLCPNSSGVYDWPDAWYEEALERMEDQLAREAQEKEWVEQLKDLDRKEDLHPEEDSPSF